MTDKNTVRYARPELTVFGSVRNLTGGSNGSDDDAFSTMVNKMKP